jgi:isopentenyl-diphosphate delta-isomerase
VDSEFPVSDFKSRIEDSDEIVLVDESDCPIGYDSKLPPHQNGGRLHRAFSVFLFNSRGQMLLQRRSANKYHFASLWTNACCSHPRRDQPVLEAAAGRLRFEMGIDVPLTHLLTFVYRAHDPVSGLTEHEVDHVFTGRFDGEPHPNPDEVMDWKWISPSDLEAEIDAHPERYTPWFRIVLQRVIHSKSTGLG